MIDSSTLSLLHIDEGPLNILVELKIIVTTIRFSLSEKGNVNDFNNNSEAIWFLTRRMIHFNVKISLRIHRNIRLTMI